MHYYKMVGEFRLIEITCVSSKMMINIENGYMISSMNKTSDVLLLHPLIWTDSNDAIINRWIYFASIGSLLNHFVEQQAAQASANVQQQILQIASVPTIQTGHQAPVVSTPVPIQPKPAPKPIAPSTINPSIVPHKQSFHSKVTSTVVHRSHLKSHSYF